jgi:hypothetical protein
VNKIFLRWLRYRNNNQLHQLTFKRTNRHTWVTPPILHRQRKPKRMLVHTIWFMPEYNSKLHLSLTHSWSWALLEKLTTVQLLKNFPKFKEPEGSSPCSREPSTGPYVEPDQSNPYHPILSLIHFNIVHPPTSWSSQWSLSFGLSHQYPICIPLTAFLKWLNKMLHYIILNVLWTKNIKIRPK